MVLTLGGGVGSLYGQAPTAQISGAVNNPIGHLAPGARVELIDMETAQRRVGQADSSGNFFFAQLFPGTYRISVSAAGFKRHEEANIFVAAAERGALIDRAQIQVLPTKGRDIMEFCPLFWKQPPDAAPRRVHFGLRFRF
jgi:hypothetical protein